MFFYIRRATHNDAMTIAALLNDGSQRTLQGHRPYHEYHHLQAGLQANDSLYQGTPHLDPRALVALLATLPDGKAVGVAIGHYGDFDLLTGQWKFNLNALFVLPAMRNQGIGYRLMHELAVIISPYTSTIVKTNIVDGLEVRRFATQVGAKPLRQFAYDGSTSAHLQAYEITGDSFKELLIRLVPTTA